MKNVLYILIGMTFASCEYEVTPKLAELANLMVVDAWLNNKVERQVINITRSQPYFDNSKPVKIPDLEVSLIDLTDGTVFYFEEGPDHYYWEPTDEGLGQIGHSYRLLVESAEETFEAIASLNRTPDIDSIIYEYNTPNFLLNEVHYTVQFYATDPKGPGDCYWIKAWKNGQFLGQPGELNMAYDASVSPGQPIDGQVFTYPIRFGFINPYTDDETREQTSPYRIGDSLYVEVHSIDRAGYDFLYNLYFQINRPGGFGELFSSPLSNVSTNIQSTDPNSTTAVAGFFNISAVRGQGLKLSQEVADQAKEKH
ncbi:MAG: DUF4249 domain-containing protein [Marinoscillum sp.]